MRQIGKRLGQATACAAIAISFPVAALEARAPIAIADLSNDSQSGSKGAVLPGANLFSVRSSTEEKMKAMSNVSVLSERISEMQERSVGAVGAEGSKLTPMKKHMVEKAFAASQSRKLAALLNQRGTCLALIGERSKAISDLDEAVTSDQNYAPAFNNRAWMMAQSGNLDAAMVDVNKALDLAPDMAEAYDTRGTIHLAQKRYDQAMKDFNSSVEHRDDYAEAYFHRAILHKTLGHAKEAQADREKAEQLHYPVPAE